MISGRKYQGRSGFRHFTRRVKSVKQAKFRLPDIQPVYLKKTAQFRSSTVRNPFFAEAGQEDIAVLFVSGHGMNSSSGYYFIAHDSNPDRLSSTGVPWTFFDEILKTVKSSVLLLADTCHSDNIAGNEKWKTQAQADPNEFLRESAKSGVIVFASSSGSTISREDPSGATVHLPKPS